ncbi:MAG: hypothetical protein HY367_02535 [Candidatus Aenigmarchaeota archaeon]|nr:hypothetical protein [Candidatus Aenigmarchaeota archaeon]
MSKDLYIILETEDKEVYDSLRTDLKIMAADLAREISRPVELEAAKGKYGWKVRSNRITSEGSLQQSIHESFMRKDRYRTANHDFPDVKGPLGYYRFWVTEDEELFRRLLQP